MFDSPAWLFIILACNFSIDFIQCLTIEPPEDEIMLPKGSSIELTCTSDEPVEWIYGLFEQSSDQSSTKNITSEVINGTYVKHLFLHNLSHMDTSYYICSAISDNEKYKKIYIFVSDPDNLLVADEEFYIIHHSPNENLVIPCKPTSPQVKVSLSYDGYQSSDYTYDNKVGFQFNRSINTAFDLSCQAELNDRNKEIYYQLLISSAVTELPTPTIELNGNQDKNNVIIGQRVELKCSVEVDVSAMIYLTWEVPNRKVAIQLSNIDMNIEGSVKQNYEDVNNIKVGSSIITIDKVTPDHAGIYKCSVLDQSSHQVSTTYNLQVLASDVKYLNLKLANGNSSIFVKPGSSKAFWSVIIDSHPPAIYEWYGPDKGLLFESNKFHIKKTPTSTEILIKGVSLTDSGEYKLVAKSGDLIKSLVVKLYVEGEPFVEISVSKSEYQLGENILTFCSILSYPPSAANVTYTVCQDYKTCGKNNNGKTIVLDHPEKSCSSHVHCYFNTRFVGTQIGYVNCSACNYLGCHWNKKIINITDVNKGLAITPPKIPLLTNETLSLTCGAAAYKYTDSLQWYFQAPKDKMPKLLTNNTDMTVSNVISSPFSHKSVLRIQKLAKDNSGTYTCLAYNFVDETKNSSIIGFDVVDGVAPYFVGGEKNFTKYVLSIGDESKWNCTISGVPEPRIFWYKNKTRIERNTSSVHLLHNNRTLKITFVKNEDAGTYKCIGFNKLGVVEAGFKLSIQVTEGSLIELYAIFGGLILTITLLVFVCIFLVKKVKYERATNKLTQQLAEAGITNFMEGNTDILNPELTLTEQANLLPYMQHLEFPRQNLHIGKQIGSGAFGVVMKATAYGIRDNEPSSTVAVKMNSDWSKVKELVTELKIMGYIGQHLNVVNLLGACTTNLHKKELLVIVEYCPFGNLHSYLMKHRNLFVNHLRENEVNPEVYQKFYKTRSMLSTSEVDTTSQSNGTCMTELTTDGAIKDTEGKQNQSAPNETPVDDEGYLMNKELEELVREAEESGSPASNKIWMSDLLCYAYQIARGMEYLASKKVLHGDLAARNILLAENNIVKICDFGLAKNMYDNDNYTKSAESKLPVKWMSIEAIRDRIFSTQSDIWAYGITLWEIFSLSTTPYPGILSAMNLLTMLSSGYRMQRPAYATKDVFNLMLECWDDKPMLRPSFTECSERIGNMLQHHVLQRYENLNNPYQNVNNKLYQQNDYVQMFNTPSYINVVDMPAPRPPSPSLSTPTPSTPVPTTPPGYLKMEKSPSINEEEVEMTPMLPKGGEN